MIENGKRYIVTADTWFYGPDGETYIAAWGTCKIEKIEYVFGFTPLRPSTNWYLRIGSDEKRPETKHEGKTYIDKDTKIKRSENNIYFAE